MTKDKTHFGTALRRYMELYGVTGSKVQKDTEIGQSTISLWKNGGRLFIEPEDMEKLAAAVTKSPSEKGELIACWLKDFKERCGEGSSLISIQVKSAPEANTLESPFAKLPMSDQVALKKLVAKMTTHPEVSRAVRSLAEAFPS